MAFIYHLTFSGTENTPLPSHNRFILRFPGQQSGPGQNRDGISDVRDLAGQSGLVRIGTSPRGNSMGRVGNGGSDR